MWKNYLKIALRNLRRNRSYTLINVVGLAVGLAVCLLIGLYVRDELSYDRFHEKADRIYRLAIEIDGPEGANRYALTSPPMAPTLLDTYPEVEEAVRIRPMGRPLISRAESRFYEEEAYFVDPSLFDVFSFALRKGDSETALQRPWSVVLSEKAARRYFGDEDPIGQTLTVDNEREFTVTGVLAPIPHQSHFQPELLASFESLRSIDVPSEQWGWLGMRTYLVLPEGYDPGRLEVKLPDMIRTHWGEEQASDRRLFLEPLTRIYLHSDLYGGFGIDGDVRYIYFLSLLAAFIIGIACINYTNLATARSASRAREVGMRKTLGASRPQLVRQFLGESVMMALLALVLALVLAELLLPAFNALTGKALSLSLGNRLFMLGGLIALGLLVGVLAGLYPAFYLTRFQPTRVLKGKARDRRGRARFRQGLVVVQFALSVLLIVGTLVVSQQLGYIKAKDPGFKKEQVIILPMQDESSAERYATIKQELNEHPGVAGVAASSATIGRGEYVYDYWPEDLQREEPITVATLFVDSDFVKTLDIELAEGRNFSDDFATDTSAFLINEAAARRFGWLDPVGKELQFEFSDERRAGQVIGVVEDFHHESLHKEIEPLVLAFRPSRFSQVAVRVEAGQLPEALDYLKAQWQEFEPLYPVEYGFLDEDFERLYRSEERLFRIFGYAAALAIFIACLGLLGLAAFTAEQRTKEIGIRKVLGASLSSIVALLSKDFVKPVLLALAIASPVGYYAMSRWLEGFAYRIDLGPWVFLVAGALALAVALLTVSYQAMKAALMDPVKALRYE